MNAEWMRERDEATAAAFADPRPGDRFHEFLSHCVYVVAREGDQITTLAASPPCRLPQDGTLRRMTLAEFRAYYAYESIPGFWVMLDSRGNDVTGWLEAAMAKESAR